MLQKIVLFCLVYFSSEVLNKSLIQFKLIYKYF